MWMKKKWKEEERQAAVQMVRLGRELSDNEKWSRRGEKKIADGWAWGGDELWWQCLHISFSLLSPSQSLTHPSISVHHSTASEAEASPHSSLLTRSTLKVRSANTALWISRISNFSMTAAAAWYWRHICACWCVSVCAQKSPCFLKILEAGTLHTY